MEKGWRQDQLRRAPSGGMVAGAKREGLRLKRTARLSQKLDASAVVLHDAHDEASNLWGAFDRARRNLPRIRLHFACKGL
jgi:hypothetical protein